MIFCRPEIFYPTDKLLEEMEGEIEQEVVAAACAVMCSLEEMEYAIMDYLEGGD